MFLLHKIFFIKQIMPPHWRSTWREVMLSALLTPLFEVYRRFTNFRRGIVNDINMSAQILVLDAAAKRVSGTPTTIVSDNNNGSFSVFVTSETDKKTRAKVKQTIEKYKPAGSRYYLRDIESSEDKNDKENNEK